MRKWILVVGLVLLGALAFAACGGDNGDANAESAQVGDGLPEVSDDARLPGEVEYRVTVSFNEDAVQADLDEVGRLFARYDARVEYVVQESFPPTGVANLFDDGEDFCERVVAELETLSYSTAASCERQLEPGDVDYDDTDQGALTDSDCEPVELRSDCSIDPDVCNEVHNIGACTDDNDGAPPDDLSTSPMCVETVPDCADTIDTSGSEGILPREEDLPPAPPDVVPSPEGQYTITIRFNKTVNLDIIDEVGARIRDFDSDAEYVIQESFPPTGVANFTADTEDACLALAQSLEAESFVTSVSCGPQLEPGDPASEEPVVNDLE
ncbi:MAG: hypothetical protein IH865_08220 [Chloroflexi bacterium]|nr:hypothetical protein [Chloroflexota bacterium]